MLVMDVTDRPNHWMHQARGRARNFPFSMPSDETPSVLQKSQELNRNVYPYRIPRMCICIMDIWIGFWQPYNILLYPLP